MYWDGLLRSLGLRDSCHTQTWLEARQQYVSGSNLIYGRLASSLQSSGQPQHTQSIAEDGQMFSFETPDWTTWNKVENHTNQTFQNKLHLMISAVIGWIWDILKDPPPPKKYSWEAWHSSFECVDVFSEFRIRTSFSLTSGSFPLRIQSSRFPGNEGQWIWR